MSIGLRVVTPPLQEAPVGSMPIEPERSVLGVIRHGCLSAFCLLATGWLTADDMAHGQVSQAPRGAEVDVRPLAVGVEEAFPALRINRPVLVTNAGDESGRLFVADQHGVIHVFANRPSVDRTTVFLDLRRRVLYDDDQDEQGLLGLAFHPDFKTNGRFFVYYTSAAEPHDSVISQFNLAQGQSDGADPQSETEILRVPQPYWNHNGGTLAFGPDGYLYIALGDGGKSRDPWNSGQDRRTLHGSILRIDVDRPGPVAPYRVPPDNPFARQGLGGKQAGARPEIWAYGLRNVWRMSFDRETKLLWAADNGEDRWEEIDLIQRGGNYGWNLREGRHKFGPNGSEARSDLIEPIWEYDHETGQSIIGGNVYYGRRVPDLRGSYIYGDYINGKIWALRYDHIRRKVIANRPIGGNELPIMTFGEDEEGEIYFTTMLGGGILYRFVTRKADTDNGDFNDEVSRESKFLSLIQRPAQ